MLEKVVVFTKKKALTIVFLCALALFLMILAKWLIAYRANETGLATQEGRVSFLSELGWEVDADTEEYKSVLLPEALEGVMEDYNEMQLAQGYDLRKFLGQKCEVYTYEVTNYPDAQETVYATLYVCGSRMVAGDIHTNSASGFMHGIKQSEAA